MLFIGVRILSILLSECNLCPRKCGINRLNNQLGYCKSGRNIKVSKAYLHKWEEPCITGVNGSGTVFFSNCNLQCVFCQNYKISQQGIGKEISTERLSEIFLELQKKGANNINLVTPTHFVPQIIESIRLSKDCGLNIPIIYNSNGYENIETIDLLNGLIDIYLPDLKYYDNKYAIQYSSAPNYFLFASKAITRMVKQVGPPKFDKDGNIKKGVIIRHMMLPKLLFDSKKIIDFIYNTFGDDVYISLMSQYTPTYNAYKHKNLNETLNSKHYSALIDYCLTLGIKNGFIQEGESCSESFIPDFNLEGI
jgi:putative pyruvate formate lyase activating enzyme